MVHKPYGGWAAIDGPRRVAIGVTPQNTGWWGWIRFIRSDGHSAWANSKALEAAGVDNNTPDPAPPAGVFGRDASGNPTGAVNGAPANTWFINHLPGVVSVESLKESTISTLNDFSEHGITGCFDAGAPIATDVSYQTLDELTKVGQSPLRIRAG